MSKEMASDNNGIRLSGFGLPLERESKLPVAQGWFPSPMTVRERAMLGLMAALKDKPEWDRKVFNEEIVAKWRQEALSFIPDHDPISVEGETDPWEGNARENGENLNIDGESRQKAISEKVFDYCIAELRDNAKDFQQRGFTEALDASACVYLSDTAISSKVKSALNQGVFPLEDVKDRHKDWHPGSDGKVLDLVHPSLFPLIYGRTRILPTGKVPLVRCAELTSEGEVVPHPTLGERAVREACYSPNFQWLPCEVSLDTQGDAKITSYINNLYPEDHPNLYDAIEKVIAASIPLWIQTLLSTQFPARYRVNGEIYCGLVKPDEYKDVAFYNIDEEVRDQMEVAIPEPHPYSRRQRVSEAIFWRTRRKRWTNYWDPPVKDCPIDDSRRSLFEDDLAESRSAMDAEAATIRDIFHQQGLQVIVKLANIHLTPEKPTYDGGGWHIEGQLNERIVASALYYYGSDNVTDSYLAFREGVDADELADQHEQDRYDGLLQIFGISHSTGSAIQVLGRVNTREDRLLVFPNVLQHRVSPFQLQDKTKPGHRKLLALFLVDPYIRIPSTANVPPQQRDWWRKAMDDAGSLTQRFPVELAHRIVEGVEGFPIGLDEAKTIRERLMEERKVDNSLSSFIERGYSFCEH